MKETDAILGQRRPVEWAAGRQYGRDGHQNELYEACGGIKSHFFLEVVLNEIFTNQLQSNTLRGSPEMTLSRALFALGRHFSS